MWREKVCYHWEGRSWREDRRRGKAEFLEKVCYHWEGRSWCEDRRRGKAEFWEKVCYHWEGRSWREDRRRGNAEFWEKVCYHWEGRSWREDRRRRKAEFWIIELEAPPSSTLILCHHHWSICVPAVYFWCSDGSDAALKAAMLSGLSLAEQCCFRVKLERYFVFNAKSVEWCSFECCSA